MANYCSNAVLFIGDKKAVQTVRDLFAEIQRKQAGSNRYHLPDFVSGGRGYMEDIETGQDWLLYETRWVPNLEVLVQIAARYELEFIAKYDEPMNGLYGEAVFTAGDLHLANLDAHERADRNEDLGLQKIREMQAELLNNNGLQR